MARDFFINGETLLAVKSNNISNIGTMTELGLAQGPVRIAPMFKHRDINVDAWGEVPAEVQWMLAEVMITASLIHYDDAVLEELLRLSMGGAMTAGGAPAPFGQMARAGARLGNNLTPAAFPGIASTPAARALGLNNNYVRLLISSPVAGLVWRFFSCYLPDPPAEFPLGTEKSVVQIRFRCIPYINDPYQAGLGAQNYILYDHNSPAPDVLGG